MKKWTTLMLARTGVIAAMYVALTYACLPVASGNIQFRLSEMLTVLPLFYIEAVPALFVGCMLANLLSGCALWDVTLGALVSLAAAAATWAAGKFLKRAFGRVSLGGLFPVALNALFLPLVWWLAYGALELGYWLNVAFLFLSQGVIVWGLGAALYLTMARLTKNIAALRPVSARNESQTALPYGDTAAAPIPAQNEKIAV